MPGIARIVVQSVEGGQLRAGPRAQLRSECPRRDAFRSLLATVAKSLSGRKRRAMRLWQRALVLAESADTPYEGARAHFEIGRHLCAGDPERARHLRVAHEAFSRLGCVTNAEAARAALEAPKAP